MDINQQVLAAYQAEHKEHIEEIRSLIGELDEASLEPGDTRLDDAFRLAHTLKGGARVCDLRPVEELGHQLESLFAAVRQQKLEWQSTVVRIVNQVLDAIEDWMSALADDLALPDTNDALSAIASLLDSDQLPQTSATSEASLTFTDELRSAFREEYTTYVRGLRQFLGERTPTAQPTAEAVEEAFRNAHSLQSAACAAELVDVEAHGSAIVCELSRLRSREIECDETLCQSVTSRLERIEAAVQTVTTIEACPPTEDTTFPDSARDTDPQAGATTEGKEQVAQAPEHVSSRPNISAETVRVDAASLDRLIRSSGQLMSDTAGQDELTCVLDKLRHDLDVMCREREDLRNKASVAIHHPDVTSEFGHLVRYINTIDQQLDALTRRANDLQRIQHRHQWKLRNRAEQVHQAAREARMVPVEGMFQSFRKMVRDLARDEGKHVEFTLRGLEHRADRIVLQALKDPLMHVLRNAVVHGVEAPPRRLELGKPEMASVGLNIEAKGNNLCVVVSDDGCGLDWDAISAAAVEQGLLTDDEASRDHQMLSRVVFEPGFTTRKDVSELAGRGMGLSVLQAAVKRLQGDLQLHSSPGTGTRIELVIPLSVSTHRMVLVRAHGQTFAIPSGAVERLVRVRREHIEILEGAPFVNYQQTPIPLVALTDLLGLDGSDKQLAGDSTSAVVLKSGNQCLALAVDAMLAERDALVHDLTGPAADVPGFFGAVLLGNGDVALVLDPATTVGNPARRSQRVNTVSTQEVVEQEPMEVLVVDDSFTTRTLEKSILEAHGYRVHIAVDGVEGLKLLRSLSVDLVICDVEMPRMDGFELLAKVRVDDTLSALPFILVTSRDQDQDRDKGLTLGADAYIVKQKFDHQILLDTISQVVRPKSRLV